MRPHATKLIEIVEQNARAIAQQWYKNVKINPKTPAYHTLPEDKAMEQALSFYSSFLKLFSTDKPFEDAAALFTKYADASYRDRIPLPQAVYALILMRRHMWLFAEYQAIFETAVDQRHALESQSRMILMFDYAEFVIIDRYDELMRKELDDKCKAMKVKAPLLSLWGGEKTK
ncbi:MAG: hypothetical protein KBH73_07610 [Syntrophobacterales bacterium]|nr:hypothetical protein [Syntrophobacterales bacterium]